MYADENIWCTQDAIAVIFDKACSTIAEHLLNAFSSGELVKDSVCRKFRRTAADGKPYDTVILVIAMSKILKIESKSQHTAVAIHLGLDLLTGVLVHLDAEVDQQDETYAS